MPGGEGLIGIHRNTRLTTVAEARIVGLKMFPAQEKDMQNIKSFPGQGALLRNMKRKLWDEQLQR